MVILLLHLLRHHICCHPGGRFVTFIDQIFNSYDTIYLYVVLNNSSLQNILLKLSGNAEYFILEGFDFTLLDHDVVNNIETYDVIYGEL